MTFKDMLDSGRYGAVYYQGKMTAKSGPFPKGTNYAHTDRGFVYSIPQAPGVYCLQDWQFAPKHESLLVRAIDVSSYQPTDLTMLICDLLVEHVVVKLYLPLEIIPQSHSIVQGKTAFLNGCTVGGYVWAYTTASPGQTIRDAMDLIPKVCPGTSVLWLDCEEYEGGAGPDGDWIQQAVSAGEELGQRVGIYTRYGYWEKIGFPEITSAISPSGRPPLWLAAYNGKADLESVLPLPGWDMEDVKGHQYTSTPVDQSVFSSDVL